MSCRWLQELQDQVARAVERDSKEELMKVRKEIVDFHGEMVLLENYSALNYTGSFYFYLPEMMKSLVKFVSSMFKPLSCNLMNCG